LIQPLASCAADRAASASIAARVAPPCVAATRFQQRLPTPFARPGAYDFPLTDNLGTVRDIVDSTGAVIDHLVDSSFGQVAYESAPTVHHLQGYTGAIYDPDTGMVNDWHRWYDPATGRFISEDPKGFAAGDANLSRYVGNDATNSIDPTGLKITLVGNANDQALFNKLLNQAIKDCGDPLLKKFLNDIINDPFEVVIGVGRNLKTVIGDFDKGLIDLGDVLKFPTTGGASTQSSAIIHEVIEQFLKQNQNRKRPWAHGFCLRMEGRFSGNTRERGDVLTQNPDGTQTITTKWTRPDGSEIYQIITISNGDVVSVRTIE